MDQKVIDCLRQAKAFIQQGWCQEVFVKSTNKGQSYCALGAIYNTNHNMSIIGNAISYINRCGLSSRFNDLPTTTQEIVIRKFDEAICLAEMENTASAV